MTPDGFGCSYTVKDNAIQFNVVSKGLESDRLGELLSQSLLDMQVSSPPTIAPQRGPPLPRTPQPRTVLVYPATFRSPSALFWLSLGQPQSLWVTRVTGQRLGMGCAGALPPDQHQGRPPPPALNPEPNLMGPILFMNKTLYRPRAPAPAPVKHCLRSLASVL